MGFPKSLLETRHGFLLERIVKTAGEVAGDVLLVGEGPLPAALSRAKRLSDVPGVEGPLGGVLAAFRWQPAAAWLVLSCDLPFVSPEALRWLVAQRRPDCMAVLPHLDSPETPEPLLALYAPSAGSRLEEASRRGERSIRRILRGEAVVSPRVPEHLRRAWTNANTAEEWAAILLVLPSRTRDRRVASEEGL